MPTKKPSREEIADEMLALGVPFELAPLPPAPPRSGQVYSPAVAFALVFACGALVAMAADRVASPGDFSMASVPTVTPALAAAAASATAVPSPDERAPAKPEVALEVTPADASDQPPAIAEAPTMSEVPPTSLSRHRQARSRTASRATPPPATTTTTTAPDRAAGWDTGNPEAEALAPSLDALLDGALGGAPDAVATSAPARTLPRAPTRRQVLTTLRALEGEVRMCGDGATGVLNASLVVAGRSGEVTSVRIAGDLAGTPASVCAARVIGSARFPHFTQERFEVSFPYRL
ncbi:MAG: hypothetical protein DRJ42_24465 [Deltaproteobacteria bacterium]|nr:MAG: hypothetical protein DRJ42_24465 [Deltaproteobacteria bacterium]